MSVCRFSGGLFLGRLSHGRCPFVMHYVKESTERDETQQLIKLGKDSITISRKKGEHAYRIPIGGGRGNAMQVKAGRIEKLF